ncbi:MAG: sugar phosphate isomerase/epimerase, partial [Opitutales bacterium]
EDATTFGYWHDTGHAQLKHRLGLLDHRSHLEAMAPRLVGFHLHDVSEGGRDHRVPGTGTIDFKMVAEFIRPEHTLVLELSPSLSRDQVRASRDYLLETLT